MKTAEGEDAKTVELSVEWASEGYNAEEADDYTFTGTVTAPEGYVLAEGLEAEATVTVKAKDAGEVEETTVAKEADKITTNAVTVKTGATADDINKAFADAAEAEVAEGYTVTAAYTAAVAADEENGVAAVAAKVVYTVTKDDDSATKEITPVTVTEKDDAPDEL